MDLSKLLDASEVLVVDLLSEVMRWDEDPYIVGLVEAEHGIYLPGSVEPVMRLGGQYRTTKGFMITDFDQIYSLKDPIVDQDGEIVITPDKLRKLKRYITTTPQTPATAVKVAISIINNYLYNLSQYTSTPRGPYKLERLVKDEYEHLIHEEAYDILMDDLIMSIQSWVGKDQHFIYFTKTVGTTLVIEKTIDFRVYDWYRIHQEDGDETT